MREIPKQFKAWWLTLAIREKKMVAVGSLAAAILIFYEGIISPYFSYLQVLRERLITSQKTLAWMQRADKTLHDVRSEQEQTQLISPVMILSVIENKVKQAKLQPFVSQLKQTSPHTIEMHFEKIEFDKCMQLLLSLVKEQRVVVTQFAAIADATPGVANVDVVMEIG